MNKLSPEDEVQKMQFIIYQIPMGVIEAGFDGNVLQMNAKAVELLMPLFFEYGLSGENINQLLQIIAAPIMKAVAEYKKPVGCIVDKYDQEIPIKDENEIIRNCHFVFTVNKLNASSVMYIFDDVTHIYEREKLISTALQEKAVEQSKFEMASGVLHDIGNAVVGFSSHILKTKRSFDQSNIGDIENLKGFFIKNQTSLVAALGEKKSQAVVDLLNGVVVTQKNNQEEFKTSLADQMKIISHIEEILSIQRQYVKGQSAERTPVDIKAVMNDATMMLSGDLEKPGIHFNLITPSELPTLKGDRTKLVQVFLNLLKNAIDAVNNNEGEKTISVTIKTTPLSISVFIADNGKGFDTGTKEKLFIRGFSTKEEGSGLGLINCQGIIEGHNGTLTLVSEGPGKGAVAEVNFNL